MERTLVGMSGGVDSSVAAALVAEAGAQAVGVTMKLWPCAETDGGFTRSDACCSPSEVVDARAVALGLGLAHYVVDLEDAFRAGVVDPFVAAYVAGETPNPCVRCNEKVKFGALWDHAQRIGARRVATGHYARVGRIDGRWALRPAADAGKDQTYFLFSLTQEQLAHADFPVGHLAKTEVRAQAAARGLRTATKHESQDICFIGREGVAGFLRREAPQAFAPGPIELIDGTVLGEHDGLAGCTIGQRKGLGVAWREPLHVVRIDRARNALVLGPRSALLVGEARLRACTWHLAPPPAEGLACLVRARHRATPVPATILPAEDGGAIVRWDEPQLRVNAGQACVAYDRTLTWCLGGGWFC